MTEQSSKSGIKRAWTTVCNIVKKYFSSTLVICLNAHFECTFCRLYTKKFSKLTKKPKKPLYCYMQPQCMSVFK